MSIKIQGSTPDVNGWTQVGPTTQPVTWGVAPAIVSDGSTIRVFGHDAAFPNNTWQIANDGTTGWSDWRKLPTETAGTFQPAAANINGEVELGTNWSTLGIAETYLP